MEVDKYPRPGGKIDAVNLTIQGGGPVPTAMVTMARLGMRPAIVAVVGDDIFGEFIVSELKKERVETSYIIKKRGHTTAIASGWIEKGTGRRTIVLDLKIDIRPGDINSKNLPGVKAVHLDGRYLPACIKVARWAKSKGIPVVFDIGSMRNDVTDILPMVDHLVCAENYALPYTGTKRPEKAIERLREICSGTIVVTSGTKGSIGFSGETEFVYQKAYRVKTADTTGAGDVYHGAYIVGLLMRRDLRIRMELASAAAAIKCTRPGGRAGIPTLGQVRAFLKKEPRTYA
jgi:sugar/nucleoside kinase (ribokinase family)